MNISELQAKIGGELGSSDWFTIDQPRIDAFADVTEDHQYIHLDPKRAAREAPFGGTIAHGYLTLSLLTHLVGQVMPPLDGLGTQINYGLNRVRFLHPVRAGSRVRATVKLHDVTERRAGQFLVECDVTVQIDGVETPALIARTMGLWV
jgi:acyl dehydratase